VTYVVPGKSLRTVQRNQAKQQNATETISHGKTPASKDSVESIATSVATVTDQPLFSALTAGGQSFHHSGQADNFPV
jgi:hypothetical protein